MARTGATLRTMARMRRLVVEEARQGLANCLAAETTASARERDAAGELARERELAAAPEADDAIVEAYVAWLPAGLGVLEAAREARDRAEAATAQARARLNASRVAEEAVQRRIAELDAAERAAALKREQAELDEVARNLRPAG